MLVSVVVPVYNQHPRLVADCISSCVNQSLPSAVELEIIFVDDGSTNNWYDHVLTDDIKLIRYEKNKGAAAAANIGVREAKGDYIQILSSDDMFYPHKTELQLSLMRLNDVQFSYTGSTEVWLDHNHAISEMRVNIIPIIPSKEGKKHFAKLIENDYGNNFINGASVMFSKEVFDSLGGYDEQLVYKPDFDFWLRILDKYNAIGIPYDLMIRRNHNNQTKHLMKDVAPERATRSIEYAIIKLKWEEYIHPVTNLGVDKQVLKEKGYY